MKLLKELGNFNTEFWCEDIYLGIQLKFNKNLFSILPIIITKSFYALIIVIIFDIINVLILENKSLKQSIISFIKKQAM